MMHDVPIEQGICTARDGVKLAYSICGSGDTGLLFIHGGLAERTFWTGQLEAFARRHRVLALDLAGHGESGSNRSKWGLPEFGTDVEAAADAENLDRIVIFGNSLGGPVAIEAALLMPGRVLGVIGVDSFQSLDYVIDPGIILERAEAFRADFDGSVEKMLKTLFHPDADPAIVAEAKRMMRRTPPEAAYSMFMGMSGYDNAAPARRLSVPLRAINGDLYPTDLEGNRKVKADFDAVIMPHMGHYPMIERPAEFNRLASALITELAGE